MSCHLCWWLLLLMTCRICCFCLKALLTWNFIGKCHLNHYKQFVLVFFNLTCSSFEWINGSDHFSPNQKKWKVLYVLITTRITVLVDIFLQKKLRKIRLVLKWDFAGTQGKSLAYAWLIGSFTYIECTHTCKTVQKRSDKIRKSPKKRKEKHFLI
jgi:hypothetical protein